MKSKTLHVRGNLKIEFIPKKVFIAPDGTEIVTTEIKKFKSHSSGKVFVNTLSWDGRESDVTQFLFTCLGELLQELYLQEKENGHEKVDNAE
jgi:hypothetical protein